MAGIHSAVGNDGKIFTAGAAAFKSFFETRSVFQIDIEMKKAKPRFGIFAKLDILLCKLLVLSENFRQVGVLYFHFASARQNGGFHWKLLKAQLAHKKHVFGKIGVEMREGPSEKIAFASSYRTKITEIVDNKVKTASAVGTRPGKIIDLASAVEA